MFYAIRRTIKVFVALCFLGAACLIYQQRSAFEPLEVLYEVYENGGITNKAELPEIKGRVAAVLDSRTFHLRTEPGHLLAVRLTGLDNVSPSMTPSQIKVEKEHLEFLKSLVLSNYLYVAVTYSNENSLLGIAYVNGTNVNTRLIALRKAELKPEYIKNLNRKTQYDFFYARRLAQKGTTAPPDAALQLGAK